jgi:hypothetical protein
VLDSTVLMSYLQWEGPAIFIGLSRPIALGLFHRLQSLKRRLYKPKT